MTRSFTIERRPLTGPRFAARPDDVARLEAIATQLRCMPKEWIESWQDLFHAMRRVGGEVAAIAERIETVEKRPRAAPQRVRHHREQLSMVTSAKGRRVSVVRKTSGQIEMCL